MAEIKIKKKEENEIDTILAEDIDFTGIVSFIKPLMIKGRINGEIKASGNLYIDEKAVINAAIEANVVSAKGIINGNIKATSKIEFFSSAHIQGDIETPLLEMESGCQFNGLCRMVKEQKEKSDENKG
jgi:cytoskeletal protein CcmA (bactofilin family)